MAYSLKADIQKEISDAELIGLTDDAGAGSMDDAKITAAIAKADALIDSYCGQVADVPFTTVPGVIKQHSITIAIYYLFARRNVVPDNRAQNYKDAVQHLRDIAAGKATLPSVNDSSIGGDDIQVSATEDDKTFSKGKTSDGSTGSLDNY